MLWILLSVIAQDPLTVEQAVARALHNNPLVAAAQERVRSAEGLKQQAALAPNPRLTLQPENIRWWGQPGYRFANDSDIFGYISQVVETGGKRARRTDVGEQSRRRAELERDLLLRQLKGRVRSTYWAAAGASLIADLVDAQLRGFRQVVEDNRNRVREGILAESDLLRVQVEEQRLEATARSTRAEAERARIALFREMGEISFPPVRFAELESPLPPPPAADSVGLRDRRTEVLLARQIIAQARANIELQRAVAKPDPELMAGYKRTSGFDTLIAGLQINLPVRNRNEGNIAAAGADLRVAEAQARAVEAAIDAEVAAAWKDYLARREVLDTIIPPMLKEAETTWSVARLAYREGGIELLRLLDAERTWLETQIFAARSRTEFRQSQVAVELALGVDQ
jgi:cobalt-zinc-cadmium efflux system outer membrane protein